MAEQVRRWEREVWALLRENIAAGRLTPFGEVLFLILEGAQLTPKELLISYLAGWDDALELTEEESTALVRELVWERREDS